MNWEKLQKEYDNVLKELTDPNIDHNRRIEFQKKASHYSEVLSMHNELEQLSKDIEELTASAKKDIELAELYQEEIEEKDARKKELQAEFEDVLYPSDERDNRSVFLEIRAGTGGQEAALFAADLFKMYKIYAESKRWTASIVDASATDIGGYKELVVFIKGKNVYKHFKFESGVHRVQRVPETETAGRVHTSTVTVAVLPEAGEVDVAINANDLRIDVYRSSGPGGQSVNTTDSAVRITHVPTGIVVTCQDERSQIKNKARAMKVLQARLYDNQKRKLDEERSSQRKKQIGTGERAEKIRTYNFPQNRVTDHRINLTLKKLDIIMQGILDDLITPLMAWDRQQRKENVVLG
jgi:peptide chain release factor 1